jgi:excisionase family DNA binding protein
MPDESDMLTTTQAAAMLGVDRATVARWVRLGQLAAVRLPSGHIRIRRRDLEKLLAEDGGEE